MSKLRAAPTLDDASALGYSGAGVIAAINARDPSLPVILLTSREELPYEDAASALAAMDPAATTAATAVSWMSSATA